MIRNITDKAGFLSSIYPPEGYLTFGPWIYLVPQYLPTSVLMLGYAGGTTAGLIRKLYGEVPITAVDLRPMEVDEYNVDFYQQNAETFVMSANRSWDALIIDLFNESYYPEEFTTQPHFVEKCKGISNYVILHTKKETDLTPWDKPTKQLALNGSIFSYYMVKRIARLPIR